MAESVHLVMFVQNLEYIYGKVVRVFVGYIADDYDLCTLLRKSRDKFRPLASLNIAKVPFWGAVDLRLIIAPSYLKVAAWPLRNASYGWIVIPARGDSWSHFVLSGCAFVPLRRRFSRQWLNGTGWLLGIGQFWARRVLCRG